MPEISAGSILGRGFAIWFRHLVPFTLLTLIVMSPILVYDWFHLDSPHSLKEMRATAWLATPLGLIATAPITYAVFRALRGERVSFAKCLSVLLGRALPVVGTVAIMAAIVVGGLLLLATLHAVPLLLFVLFLVMAALLIWLWCMWWVAIPVNAVERPGPWKSLRRSTELTHRARGKIFLLWLTLTAIDIGVVLVVRVVIGSQPMRMLVDTMFDAPLTALTAVTSAVAYHDLRLRHEGAEPETLASVFD